jgi:hypothetical protein
MSRRCHHGSPRHARQGPERRHPGIEPLRRPSLSEPPAAPAAPLPTGTELRPPAFGPLSPPRERVDQVLRAEFRTQMPAFAGAQPPRLENRRPLDEPPAAMSASPGQASSAIERPDAEPPATDAWSRDAGAARAATAPVPHNGNPPGPAFERRGTPPATNGDDQGERGATAPQLRRFIKSRAYVPMHELRRRFAINGHDDEVTAVDLERRRVFVGLPDREGRLLAELLRGGDIGYELSMDPITPIVVGVYPMRPVTRP